MLTCMAALGWLTPRRRSATARSVLAGEAAAQAARTTSRDTAPATPEVTLFDPAKVRTIRYRYRGAKIPTPWPGAAA